VGSVWSDHWCSHVRSKLFREPDKFLPSSSGWPVIGPWCIVGLLHWSISRMWKRSKHGDRARRTMACMEWQMRKPQGFRQEASEQLLCFFVLCLPYYQSLLFAGMSGMISFLLLTFLLMFMVARSPAIYRVITTCLNALPLSRIPPNLKRQNRRVGERLCAVKAGPSLAPSFQRPPPIFS
jgi:hypothetical protein